MLLIVGKMNVRAPPEPSDLGVDSGLEQPMKQMMEACVGGYAAAPITAK
jgi:hypothetical protein